MNMKQLETFYWVERLGSFSAAAERVHATQSTISMRIQELEQSLGVRLFDRSHRMARLTAKGRELLPYVRQMVELTSAIAWENYRARFDHAFGIEAEGFSAGAFCPLPSARR